MELNLQSKVSFLIFEAYLMAVEQYDHDTLTEYEPRHEKTHVLPMRKQRRRSATRLQCLCFRYLGSTIPLPPLYKISSL